MTGFNEAYEPAPLDGPTSREHRRRLAQVINRINQGKLNAVTSLTFRASQTTTTLTDERIGMNSFLGLAATTANAATTLVAGVYYVATRGSAVFHHASNAAIDQTFAVCIFG